MTQSGVQRTGTVWMILTILFVIVSVILFIKYQDQAKKLDEALVTITDLSERVDFLEEERTAVPETLPQPRREEPVPREVSPLSQFETRLLRSRGLNDPVNDITNDLLRRTDLISEEGVLGGTMGFYSPDNIRILNSRWVFAYFEDGHVRGSMLLQYEVEQGGRIHWKVLDSFMD
jgi:hypothetical protein